MTLPTDELAATPDDQSEDYRRAMLYHSDRADALMQERDDLAAETAALRAQLAKEIQKATHRREALRGQAIGIKRMKGTIREMKNQNRIKKIGLRDTKELAEAGLRIANQRSHIAALTKALSAERESRPVSVVEAARVLLDNPEAEARFVIAFMERECLVTFGDKIGMRDMERIRALAALADLPKGGA